LQVYLLLICSKKVCVVAAISMDTTVDMSLDDIIKKNRERGRGRGRASRGRDRGPGRFFNNGRMSGAVRRGPLSVNARPPKYSIAKASSKLWMVYA
jgi:THO complex subunit 4